MHLVMRPYNHKIDYWRIRAFLRDVFERNDYRERSWHVYRWDYCRWHVWENIVQPDLAASVFVWETPDRQIAAVLNIEDPGQIFLQVHPAWRSVAVEEGMLDVAEACLAVHQADGMRKVQVWANVEDTFRQDILRRRGYRQDSWVEYQRRQMLDRALPSVAQVPGYTVRALGDEDELPARSWASFRAFHPHDQPESYAGWQWYKNIQRATIPARPRHRGGSGYRRGCSLLHGVVRRRDAQRRV